MTQTFLLVHGWGGSTKSLEQLGEELKKLGHVHFLELPGHGTTAPMDKPWVIEDFKQYIKNYVQRSNLDNLIYIGHSFGGNLGMRLAIDNTKFLNKLILIDVSGIKPRNSAKKLLWKILSVTAKPILNTLLFPVKTLIRKVVYKYLVRERDYLNTSGTVKETFKKIINEHINPKDLKKINVDTLIIWGDHDTYTPLWMGEILNKQISNSKFHVLEGTHGLPLKKPREVGEIIKNWLIE